MSNLPVENYSAAEVAEFETVAEETPVLPIKWSVQKYKAAQLLALEGKTKTAIAKELGIPLSAMNTWLKHPDFQTYMDQLVSEAATKIKNKKIQLLMKTLAAREAEAEEEGYSTFSRKDSLDIMAELRKETGEERGADTSYTNLLEKLVANSIKNQPKIINMEEV